MIRMSGLAQALLPAIDVNTAAGTPTVSRIMVSWSPVTKDLPPPLVWIVSAIPVISTVAAELLQGRGLNDAEWTHPPWPDRR